MLSEQQIGQIARISFELYKDHRVRDGLPVEYENYDDQPQTLIRSGLQQVRDIERKMGILGYEIVPAEESAGREVVEALDESKVEELAIIEHDRWVADRAADGWVYGPVKDVDRKVTPYLVPYDELTEQVKDYDREPVRNMLPLLHAVGYVVCK